MMNPQMQVQMQAHGAYRSFPQQQQMAQMQAQQLAGRTPARRPGQPPPGGMPAANVPNPRALEQADQARQHQSAQRRSKKPQDRMMPDGVEDFIIGEGVAQYRALRETERRLDAAMLKKRLDVQDSMARDAGPRAGKMRIWISNTVESQQWQDSSRPAIGEDGNFDFETGEDARWKLKIEGKVLDEDEPPEVGNDGDEDGDTEMGDEDDRPKKKPRLELPTKRMSHYFKSIKLEFDKSKNLNSADPMADILWEKEKQGGDFDSLEIDRKGDENLNITISFIKAEPAGVERFRLSQALAQTLDMEEATRPEAVMAIWEYIKAMGLQEDEEKRTVRCDDRLRQIFGADTIYFPQIPERLNGHLLALPATKLAYTIRTDEAFQTATPAQPTIYDITISHPDPLRARMSALLQSPTYLQTLQTITRLDDQLALIIQAIQHSKAKRTFYSEMERDPVNFIKRWTSSQKRDLEVIMGEAQRGGGEDGMGPEFARGGRGGVWDSAVVKEAVRYMLGKPDTAAR